MREGIERSESETNFIRNIAFNDDNSTDSERNTEKKKRAQESLVTYRPEYLKTFICFLALLVSLILNQLVICLAHDITSRNALPDLVFTLVPEQEWALAVGDMLTCIAGIIALGFIAVFHRYRIIVLRRLIFTITVLYTFRAICLSVTHIPASYQNNYHKCIKPNYQATVLSVLKRFAQHSFKLGLQISENGKLVCGDLLFSGHTIFVSTTTFYFNHYSPHSIWPLSLYHSFILLPHHVRIRTRAYRRLLLFWTMYELEVNVPSGRLQNEIEWPLPWPKCLKRCVRNWNRREIETLAGRIAEKLDAHRVKTHL
uniref:Bm9738 n=1 Tax=Brugia malayi TaxID=6279 RepID=A0A0I9N5H1_BRUMA|nr:Bm9738 [Brugia malayi]